MMSETKQFVIRFVPKASEALKDMAKEEGITAAELVRRAVNFYQVRMEAKRENKKILLESKDGAKEWVMV